MRPPEFQPEVRPCPHRPQKCEIHLRSNPRWRTAPKWKRLNSYKSATVHRLFDFGVNWCAHGSMRPASCLKLRKTDRTGNLKWQCSTNCQWCSRGGMRGNAVPPNILWGSHSAEFVPPNDIRTGNGDTVMFPQAGLQRNAKSMVSWFLGNHWN